MKITTESLTNSDVDRMKAKVSQLASETDLAVNDLTIDLVISGGSMSERLQFKVTLSPQGTADIFHMDELHGVTEQFSSMIPSGYLAAFAQHLDIDSLTKMPPNEDEKYIPDSLVGTLALRTGNSRLTLRFPLEDEEPSGSGAAAMKILTDKSVFFLRSSMAPPSVHAALDQLATIVNTLYKARK